MQAIYIQGYFNLVINSNFVRYEFGWIWLNLVEFGWIGLTWIDLGWLGLTWDDLGWLGLNWVELGWIGLHWVELGWIGTNWVELGLERKNYFRNFLGGGGIFLMEILINMIFLSVEPFLELKLKHGGLVLWSSFQFNQAITNFY